MKNAIVWLKHQKYSKTGIIIVYKKEEGTGVWTPQSQRYNTQDRRNQQFTPRRDDARNKTQVDSPSSISTSILSARRNNRFPQQTKRKALNWRGYSLVWYEGNFLKISENSQKFHSMLSHYKMLTFQKWW